MKTNINFKDYDHMDYLDTSSPNVTEEKVLEYLASIISTIYLKAHHPDVVIANKAASEIRQGLFPGKKK